MIWTTGAKAFLFSIGGFVGTTLVLIVALEIVQSKSSQATISKINTLLREYYSTGRRRRELGGVSVGSSKAHFFFSSFLRLPEIPTIFCQIFLLISAFVAVRSKNLVSRLLIAFVSLSCLFQPDLCLFSSKFDRSGSSESLFSTSTSFLLVVSFVFPSSEASSLRNKRTHRQSLFFSLQFWKLLNERRQLGSSETEYIPSLRLRLRSRFVSFFQPSFEETRRDLILLFRRA